MKLLKRLAFIFIMIFVCTLTNGDSGIPVRGIWLPISGTKAPYSVDGIKQVVQKCKELGINSIYFAVWNQSKVNFELSEEFKKLYPFIEKNSAFSIDPLKELINEAHKNNIRVIAWFEYGFATSYNDPTGGPIFLNKPEWKAIDNEGNLVIKNKFQWMNAFDPDVQTFMINLIKDLILHYNVDGIQGDDRMPALPVTAGYDKYTVELYKELHKGSEPPEDYNNADWIQWRCDLLNKFMGKIHNMIRQFKTDSSKNLTIEMAPSVYPWSKSNYLQDWPVWVKNGWVDKIYPQIYRYSAEAYNTTLAEELKYISENDFNKFYPGVLIGVGGKITANKDILKSMIEKNRASGIKGEVFFYYESLTDNEIAGIIKEEYTEEFAGKDI